jgi:hypothetical protein
MQFKVTAMASLSAFYLLASLINHSVSTSIPRALAWSSKTYGPDGPWHAITVEIGTPAQAVDLFPGGFWQSNVISSTFCQHISPEGCLAPLAGVYNSNASSGATSLSTTGDVQNSTFADKGMLSLFGSGEYVFDTASIVTEDPPSASVSYPDFDMLVVSKGSEMLPDGTKYVMEVGNLALGAPEVNQSWNDGNGRFNSSLVPSYLYLTEQVPSNSFGMHIGSTALGIPPSLYIGGYDQSRVLGEVTVQDYNMHYFPIDLLDIGIGVAEGASPFPFTSKSGLLASGNSSVGVAMQVIVDPIAPFLYLPKSTCDAITANLPVKYQPNLGLYFWDTTSVDYEKIVTSPAFLGFTFRMNSSVTQNMTINVPFSLLNLTLSPPLVTTPTQYFPCNAGFDYGKSYGEYTLGKAFLQAAFLGVNWGLNGDGSWFLAQAPGPNTPSQAVVQEIGLSDNFVSSSANVWSDTWKGAWTVIPGSAEVNSTGDGENSDKNKGGDVGKGAVIGIAIAAVVVGVICLAAAGLFWRGSKMKSAARGKVIDSPIEYQPAEMQASLKRPWELADEQNKRRLELDSERDKVELPG